MFKEIKGENSDLTTESNVHPISISKITVDDVYAHESLSVVEQFFIAPFVLTNENPTFHIPFRNKERLIQSSTTIGAHFNDLQIIDYDSKHTLVLSDLKESAKVLFQNRLQQQKIKEMILEIYQKNQMDHIQQTTDFEVDLNKINPLFENDTIELWEFINETFIQTEGNFTLLTLGWDFNDPIKDYKIVRSIASFYKHIEVTVDMSSNQIICLSIK